MRYPVRGLSFVASILIPGLPAHAQAPPALAFNPMHIEFMSGPIAFDNEPVTGAPYSAEAVTEVVQTLSDGNRIVRESRAQISRDGKGRTRREQGLAMFGPIVGGPNGASDMRHVQISDPGSHTTIMLDLQSRIAHKVPAPQFAFTDKFAAAGVKVEHFEMAVPPPPPGSPHVGVQVFRSRETVTVDDASMKPVVETLGKQFMEGVEAEGTRTKMTIPAGQIGNELPITVVSERWLSPELKVLVMSRQSDPRYGETTYRLTNITRGEPSPELFEVPSDFKIVEPGGNRDVIMERKIVK
jgi:hypothetical protein